MELLVTFKVLRRLPETWLLDKGMKLEIEINMFNQGQRKQFDMYETVVVHIMLMHIMPYIK
jgi:hypothetical protein